MSDTGSRDLRVAFRTLGCKVNRVESETIAAALLGRGAEVVEADEASVIVVNTCTVTGEADAKARKAVRHALKAARLPVVVVTGCLAALDHGDLASLDDRVVVESDKARVAARVAELLALGDRETPPPARTGDVFRTRAVLKIEDGCDAFCAYCIVPYARGVPRAVALRTVVAEAGELVSAGAREIVLTGINVGRYDDGGAGLPELIETLANTGVARLRLSSIEPLDITPRLLEVMGATPSFCRHLHVPLQAGSDAVLAEMGRDYTVAEYGARIAAAREAMPGLAVSTDVIAGFPGESPAQADDTLRYCAQAGFSKLHVFRYSRRAGTPAAARADQVPAEEKSARAQALRDCGSHCIEQFARSRLGTAAEVLVERVAPDLSGIAVAEGTTRDYLRVRFSAPDAARGQLANVVLDRVDRDRVLGVLVD